LSFAGKGRAPQGLSTGLPPVDCAIVQRAAMESAAKRDKAIPTSPIGHHNIGGSSAPIASRPGFFNLRIFVHAAACKADVYDNHSARSRNSPGAEAPGELRIIPRGFALSGFLDV
jgi:hypothetical protein